MKLFCRTGAAQESMEQGIKDGSAKDFNDQTTTCLWLSNRPINLDEGGSGETVLVFEIPEEAIADCQWVDDDKKTYRKILVPKDLVDKFGPPLIFKDRVGVIGWRDRVTALWHIVPIVGTAALNLTPLIFFPGPPDLRKLLFVQLSRSELFALSRRPEPPDEIPGVTVWHRFHVYAMVVAHAFLPVGIPLALWLWLDLGSFVTEGLNSKVLVAQLLTTTVVGAVAVDVFLSGQLQRLTPVRISAAFLQNNTFTTYEENFVHRHNSSERFHSGQLKWVHIRVTNVGMVHLSDFQMRGEFPTEWKVPKSYISAMSTEESAVTARVADNFFVDESDPAVPMASYGRAFDWAPQRNQFTFPTRLRQVGLGPGTPTVFSILVMAPIVEDPREFYVKISVSSSSAGSSGSDRLRLVVDPNNNQTPA